MLFESSSRPRNYLVNTSGKIQKNKTNVKDKNDTYYCTDAEGLVTYKGYEAKRAKRLSSDLNQYILLSIQKPPFI